MMLTPDDQIMSAAMPLPQPSAAPPLLPSARPPSWSDFEHIDMTDPADPFASAPAASSIFEPLVRDVAAPDFAGRFATTFHAGTERARAIDNFTAGDNALIRHYEPIVEAVNRDRSPAAHLPNPGQMSADERLPGSPAFVDQNTGIPVLPSRSQAEEALWAAVEQMRKENPGAAGNLPANKEELLRDIADEQRAAIAWSDKTAAEGGPLSGGTASFLGQAWAAITDPPNILMSMLGGGPAKTLLNMFLREGSVNAAITLAGMPERIPRYEAIGQPITFAQAAGEVAGSAFLGGFIPTAGKALAHAVGLGGRPLIEAFAKAIPDPSPLARTARTIVEDEVNRAADNPFTSDAAGEDLHRQALIQAASALNGGPESLPQLDGDIVRAADPAVEAAQRAQGYAIESFDPRDFTFDAAAMQFKRGADERGVTDRLSGVQQWDPTKAGLILGYEYRDGRLVPADGHQRVALAQAKIESQPDIKLFGFRLREADGVTPQEAKVMAALKNIAEGTGDTIDAAAVLRNAPERVSELPPRSPLVRRAKELANLGPDAWGMAWNGVASERDAAIVGRLVNDHAMQTAILGHLAGLSPDTAEEAELFVRQALAAGAAKQIQADMFGEFVKSDLVFPERARILKNTLSTLRRDKALFKTLTDRENEIAAAGNVLNTAENARRGDVAVRAFGVLKALAERKGPISDALQAAAEKSLKGERAAATRDFTATVRRAVAEGRLDGELDGGNVGPVDVAPEATPALAPGTAHEDLKLFADPENKPAAFRQQSADLAQELAPPKAPTEPAPAGEIPQNVKPEFGGAQAEVEAIRALPQDQTFPDPFGEGEVSVKAARREIERQARATEALRNCMEGGG